MRRFIVWCASVSAALWVFAEYVCSDESATDVADTQVVTPGG